MSGSGSRSGPGTTEQSYRDWIATLGELTEKQKAEAEQVYVLAAIMDRVRDGDVPSGIAATSRELRQLVAMFRDGQRANVAGYLTPVPEPAPVPRDEIAERRAAHTGKTVTA